MARDSGSGPAAAAKAAEVTTAAVTCPPRASVDRTMACRMIARLAGDLPAFESRFGRTRRAYDPLPVLAEVVAGAAIFRLLVSRDAALDEQWVDEVTALITERWPGRVRSWRSPG